MSEVFGYIADILKMMKASSTMLAFDRQVQLDNKKHWLVACIALILIVISLAIGFGISASNNEMEFPASAWIDGNNSEHRQSRESILGNYSMAAVATDGGSNVCAQIGK